MTNQKQNDSLETRAETKVSNQISTPPILSRLLSWYHDERAYGYRLATVNFHLASCGFVTPETRSSYLQRASACAEKSKIHWNLARKYDGGS